MRPSQWSVLVFGDSWADYMHPTWPQVLGRRLGARVINFAQAGSMCADIRSQAQRALISPEVPKAVGGLLQSETLVVIHTCGNDFIMKMAEAFMGGGLGGLFGGGGGASLATPEMLQPNPGVREAAFMKEFLESMHRAGARHFLVSGVPIFLDMPVFNMALPIITGMVNSGRLEALGVSPGDPPRLAVEVQASALHERWEELVQAFNKGHPDSKCIFFDEVAALERLRLSFGEVFDRSMWDFSMFHPTAWGHEQLAVEAQRVATEQIPGLSGTPAQPAAKASSEAKPNGYTTAASAAGPAPANGGAAAPTATASQGKQIKVQVRNVKGDVSFEVPCDSSWNTARFREEVLSKAPSGFSDANSVCVFAMKGKFLSDASTDTLEQMGLHEGGQVIAVIKPKSSPPR
ncbi:unnamed protein product [Symbiodinium natans]|uniref:Ubiquitin-like domain-containing protein n=1 Tax=Symbiodinium natans TaxID=878477 RepID=A0A812I9Y9_9DINO|nr:unnamed protein product [Symbiodinium natans]